MKNDRNRNCVNKNENLWRRARYSLKLATFHYNLKLLFEWHTVKHVEYITTQAALVLRLF